MVEKGIEVKTLLDSEVFKFNFELDEWPSNHFNSQEDIRPYNENIFQIRKHYRTIFPESSFEVIEDAEEMQRRARKFGDGRIYKVNYSINFLPMLGTHLEKRFDPYANKTSLKLFNSDINLLQILVDSDQLDIFESENLAEAIDFKWK